jgi:hypothetical protein
LNQVITANDFEWKWPAKKSRPLWGRSPCPRECQPTDWNAEVWRQKAEFVLDLSPKKKLD